MGIWDEQYQMRCLSDYIWLEIYPEDFFFKYKHILKQRSIIIIWRV